MDGYYSTSAYPTTGMTFTEADEDGNITTHTYIFAGWYSCDEDAGFTAMATFQTETDAYAKFVDADVMKVYCVFTPLAATGSGNFWRFVSSMDVKQYSTYQILLTDSDGNAVSTIDSTSMRRTTGNYTLTSISRTFTCSDDFCSAAKYIVTGSYTDANSNYDTLTATVTWTTMDGTVVTGASYTFSHNNATSTKELTAIENAEEAE